MKFAKIRFESREARVRAVQGLMQRAKVVALRDGIFIVPEPALEWLTTQNIPYTLVHSVNQDDVFQTLRNQASGHRSKGCVYGHSPRIRMNVSGLSVAGGHHRSTAP